MALDIYVITAGPSLAAALKKKPTQQEGIDELGLPLFITEPMLAFMGRVTVIAYAALGSSVPISRQQLREAIDLKLPTAENPVGRVFIKDGVHYSSPKQKKQASYLVAAARKAKAAEGNIKLKTPTNQKELESFRAGLTSAAENLKRQGKSFRASGAATVLSHVELAFLLEKGGALFRGKRRNKQTKKLESVFLGQGAGLRQQTFTKQEAVALATKKFAQRVGRKKETFEQIVERISQDKLKKQRARTRKEITRDNQLRIEYLVGNIVALQFRKLDLEQKNAKDAAKNFKETDFRKISERIANIKKRNLEIDQIKKTQQSNLKERQQLVSTGVRTIESIRAQVEADLLEPYLRERPRTTVEKQENLLRARNSKHKTKIGELQNQASAIKTEGPRLLQEIKELEQRISDDPKQGSPYERSLLTRKKQAYAELTKKSREQLAAEIQVEKRKILDRKQLQAEVEKFGRASQWRRSQNSLAVEGFNTFPKGSPTANWLKASQSQLNDKLTGELGKIPADMKKAAENSNRILERSIEEFLDFKKTTGVQRSF